MDLDSLETTSGFLNREIKCGGEETLRNEMSRWFQGEVGHEWYLCSDRELLEALSSDEGWLDSFVLDIDVGLYLSTIRTIKYMALQQALLPPPEAPPDLVRRRLKHKQPRPPAFPEPPPRVVDPPPAVPMLLVDAEARGIRAPKSRQQPSYRIHREGEFVCAVCDRKFPN